MLHKLLLVSSFLAITLWPYIGQYSPPWAVPSMALQGVTLCRFNSHTYEALEFSLQTWAMFLDTVVNYALFNASLPFASTSIVFWIWVTTFHTGSRALVWNPVAICHAPPVCPP